MGSEQENGRWFNFFMAMTIVGLGCIGAMIMVLNNQLWSKMDRMVSLFQERSRDVGLIIERQNDRVGCLEGHVIAIKSRLDMLEKDQSKTKK
jgi:hypothetical protein